MATLSSAPKCGPKSGMPVDLTSDLVARFWAKVDKRGADECWPWLGHRSKGGYGRITIHRGTQTTAHRVSVLISGRSIPPTFVVDHRCRNRGCVNPKHLRVVSVGANTLAENSQSVTAHNARRTHCKCGLEFSPANARYFFDGSKNQRRCKACLKAAKRRYTMRQIIHQKRSWGDDGCLCGRIGRLSEAVLSPDLVTCKKCRRIWSAEVDRDLEAKFAARRLEASAMPTLGTGQLEEGWQPIETAPKDGTGVLVICMGAERPSAGEGWFIGGKWTTLDPECSEEFGEDFYHASTWMEPTHWQPLPEPPAQPEIKS